jgi:hypothetical protein
LLKKQASYYLLIYGTLLAYRASAWVEEDHGPEMKIYMLLMLIAVILGLSHRPLRFRAKRTSTVPPVSLPA